MATQGERANALAAAAPCLTAAELEEINALYPVYIFRRRKTREVWTSCCGRHETIPEQDYTDAQHAALTADHCGEITGRGNFYSLAQRIESEGDNRELTACPFCGAEGYVKELGRTGDRKNLIAYKRVVILRLYRGGLWARAYYTSKEYIGDNGLTARPVSRLHKVYRFKTGEASCATKSYYHYDDFRYLDILTGRPEKLPLPFYEPFSYNSAEGSEYTLIGAGEISKSPFKYCQYDRYFRKYCSYMRFLAVCCIYPRQVEMLMKAGMEEVVSDLVEGRKWNAAAFDWEKPDPLESFQLNKAEMRDFLSGDKNLEALGYYKQFRRKKISCTIPEVEEIVKLSTVGKAQSVVKRLKEHRIEPRRWLFYMAKELKAENAGKKKGNTVAGALHQFWIDYIDAAVVLGYDLTNPLMQMPKGIMKKHDDAVSASAPIIAERLKKELGQKEKRRQAQVSKRYEFALGDYIIRAPINSEEIVSEGKALKHCVGGYAQRHLDGKLTILFLRAAAKPFKPLVTIEMNGNRLVQIHGYENDYKAKVQPEEKYACILEPWLEWVQAGSKRDKKGNPVTPGKRKKTTEEVTAA